MSGVPPPLPPPSNDPLVERARQALMKSRGISFVSASEFDGWIEVMRSMEPVHVVDRFRLYLQRTQLENLIQAHVARRESMGITANADAEFRELARDELAGHDLIIQELQNAIDGIDALKALDPRPDIIAKLNETKAFSTSLEEKVKELLSSTTS